MGISEERGNKVKTVKEPSVETKIEEKIREIVKFDDFTEHKLSNGLEADFRDVRVRQLVELLSTQQAQMRDKIKGLVVKNSRYEGLDASIFYEGANQAITDVLELL